MAGIILNLERIIHFLKPDFSVLCFRLVLGELPLCKLGRSQNRLSVVTTIAEKTSIYGTHARVGTINLVEILACFF